MFWKEFFVVAVVWSFLGVGTVLEFEFDFVLARQALLPQSHTTGP
jgi:hypothetical protein